MRAFLLVAVIAMMAAVSGCRPRAGGDASPPSDAGDTSTPLEAGDVRALSVGDVNGDGYADLVVAELGQSVPYTVIPGQGTIFLGGATGVGISPASIIQHATVALGDVNGDGFGDVLSGALYLGNVNGIDATRPTVW